MKATYSIFCQHCDALILETSNLICPVCDASWQAKQSIIGQTASSHLLESGLAAPYVTFAADPHHLFVITEDHIHCTTIHALEPLSANIIWSYPLTPDQSVRHLVFHQGVLLLSPENSQVISHQQADLIALNGSDGSAAWRTTLPSHSLTPPVLLEDKLFVAGSSGEGYLLSLSDGALINTISACPAWASAFPLLHQNDIFIGGRTGEIRQTPPFSKTAQPFFALDDEDQWFDKGLAASDKLLFAPNWDNHLYALDIKTGEMAWKTGLDRGASSPPVVGQHLYIGIKSRSPESRKRVYGLAAYDLENGELVWFYETGQHVEAPAAVVDDLVFVASRDGQLAALNRDDGVPQWTVDLEDRPRSVPLIVGDHVVVGTQSGKISAIPWRENKFDWDGLEPAKNYRVKKEWGQAGTAAALQGDFKAAAEDFGKAGEAAHAARLYAHIEDWPQAAAAYIEAGELENASRAYEQAGDLLTAAQLLASQAKFEEAAKLYEKGEKWGLAAEHYEKDGMLAQAAPLFVKAGESEQATRLYLSLDQPEEAAAVLNDAGQVVEAANLLQQAGKFELAARFLEEGEEFGRAALLWKERGREEDAIRLYLLNGDLAPALDIALDQQNWDQVRDLAFDLNRFEIEGDANLKLAESAEGNAKLDHYISAGQAFVRAAQSLEADQGQRSNLLSRPQREKLAALWERAIQAFEQGLEEPETIRSCRREVGRLLQLPELTLDISAVRELVVGEYHSLLVKVTNVGFGTATKIYMRVIKTMFEGDINHTQHMRGVRPGQSRELVLRVMPLEDAVGSAVPLDLELSYSLLNGKESKRSIRGQVPVKRQESGHYSSGALDPKAHRPSIDIYQDNLDDSELKLSHSAPHDLRLKMLDAFNLSELKDICFDMNINFENLNGQKIGDKVRELILYCERSKRVEDLLSKCASINGSVEW